MPMTAVGQDTGDRGDTAGGQDDEPGKMIARSAARNYAVDLQSTPGSEFCQRRSHTMYTDGVTILMALAKTREGVIGDEPACGRPPGR
jgi:hypothetical protein